MFGTNGLPLDLVRKVAKMYDLPDVQVRWRLYSRKSQPLLLETDHQQYVLLPLGSPHSLYCLREQHFLARWLAERGFPTPYPLLNSEGSSFTIIDNAIFVMYQFVKGDTFQYENSEHITSTAIALAQYHLLVGDYPVSKLHRAHESCPASKLHKEFCQELTDKANSMNSHTSPFSFSQGLDSDVLDKNDLQYVAMRIPLLAQIISDVNYRTTLPNVLVHGDISPSNIILGDNKLLALLDFERSHYDARIVDIGIALARLTCTQDKLCLKPDLVQAFMSAYNDLAPLEDCEFEILSLMVEGKIAMSVVREITTIPQVSARRGKSI
jgi:Ser/Thr protein kinase RdoA (MazF antagonist)